MVKIPVIGIASSVAANEGGSEEGPTVVAHSTWNAVAVKNGVQCQWEEIITPKVVPDKMDIVASLCAQLAKKTWVLTQKKQPFTVIGGDHSCAVGTWTGVSVALPSSKALGLLWIDAHLDSHTPDTTKSGNIHGMPLASLLGHGDPRLTQLLEPHPKIQPAHLCILGARSFEPEEMALMRRLDVRVYEMREIQERGFVTVFEEALEYVAAQCDVYGISVDLDAVDPTEAPGVSVPVKGGISAEALCTALRGVQGDPQFVGLEIAEFNPRHDKDELTEHLIFDILSACFSEGKA